MSTPTRQTPMRQRILLAAADVSEGSIYNHFPSKTALIATTMAELTSGGAQIRFLAELLPITGPTLGNHQLRNWLREGGPSPGARGRDRAAGRSRLRGAAAPG
jgi:AcrR family transcriptional regulator